MLPEPMLLPLMPVALRLALLLHSLRHLWLQPIHCQSVAAAAVLPAELEAAKRYKLTYSESAVPCLLPVLLSRMPHLSSSQHQYRCAFPCALSTRGAQASFCIVFAAALLSFTMSSSLTNKLALVELQLCLRACDLPTFIVLATCSVATHGKRHRASSHATSCR